MNPEENPPGSLPEDFRRQIERAGLRFSLPPGFAQVAPRQNDRVLYHCAIGMPSPKLEVRFHIVPLEDLSSTQLDQPAGVADRNTLHEQLLLALVHNVATEVLVGPDPLDAELAGPGLGADRGTLTRLRLAPSSFSEGFRECVLLSLHRDDVADAYVFFMFEQFPEVKDLVFGDGLAALRFKPDFDLAVEACKRGDIAGALERFHRLAEGGDARAQFSLARMLDDEDPSSARFAEAVGWYRKAADGGHPEAQLIVGTLLARGFGVPQDHGAAVRWFRLAAEQGHASAQYLLGHCHEQGHGVTADPETALEWYRRAAENGDEGARERVRALTAPQA